MYITTMSRRSRKQNSRMSQIQTLEKSSARLHLEHFMPQPPIRYEDIKQLGYPCASLSVRLFVCKSASPFFTFIISRE